MPLADYLSFNNLLFVRTLDQASFFEARHQLVERGTALANPKSLQGWGSELILALCLLIPRLAAYAAGGLIVIMGGALVTVLANPGPMGPVPPIVHLVVLTIILRARWRVRWRPSTRGSA